jgi:molecular chaperone DnaK
VVGDGAMNAQKSERLNALKNWDSRNDNSFVEFTRTLGSDVKYESSNAKRSFSSEELLAEVLKQLISSERDFDINAAVITVPSAFGINQINAVRKAGFLAGLKQIEILQEPIAASIAHGLNFKDQDCSYLVFDFEEKSFDAALINLNNGIIKIIDNEGNQFYGSSIVDEVIVNEIILPHLEMNFEIHNLLCDDFKNNALKNSLRFYAKEIKKQLSFIDETSILTNLGDLGEDDEGSELELDMIVTAAELEKAIAPIFQKALDLSLELLKRNNLKGSDLNSLILVGKPTYSSVLRSMLSEQICKPDTSIDPETIIVKGAAFYASSIDLNDELRCIDVINEKYDREYLELFEKEEMTLLEVKESLEESNRQNGIVYKEVLVLLDQENKNITKEKVENLLFQLTEDSLMTAKIFQEFYEELSSLIGDYVLLENLYNKIKVYDTK